MCYGNEEDFNDASCTYTCGHTDTKFRSDTVDAGWGDEDCCGPAIS